MITPQSDAVWLVHVCKWSYLYTVCCSVLQCVAVCCSVLHCVAVRLVHVCKWSYLYTPQRLIHIQIKSTRTMITPQSDAPHEKFLGIRE